MRTTQETDLTSISPALIAAACKVAAKDIDRSVLPQSKAVVPIDVVVHLHGVLSFGNPTTQKGQIPYRAVLARTLDYLAAFNPKLLESLLVQFADWGVEASKDSEARADAILEPLRGESSQRSGSVGGVVEFTIIED